MKVIAGAVLLLASVTAAPAVAQFPGAPIMAPCIVQTNLSCLPITSSNPLPVGSRESFGLIAANVPTAGSTVFGGDYILSQTCTTYGTLNLQALGPDGVTWQTILSKTASDTAGGTGMSLGSYAQVRITVTGTTGCNAILARVPA